MSWTIIKATKPHKNPYESYPWWLCGYLCLHSNHKIHTHDEHQPILFSFSLFCPFLGFLNSKIFCKCKIIKTTTQKRFTPCSRPIQMMRHHWTPMRHQSKHQVYNKSMTNRVLIKKFLNRFQKSICRKTTIRSPHFFRRRAIVINMMFFVCYHLFKNHSRIKWDMRHTIWFILYAKFGFETGPLLRSPFRTNKKSLFVDFILRIL